MAEPTLPPSDVVSSGIRTEFVPTGVTGVSETLRFNLLLTRALYYMKKTTCLPLTKEGNMATAYHPPVEEHRVLKAKPRRNVDREALRADINQRYENTLRYLGR